MTRFGKLWTDAVAYVALAIGAGLSIAGNVADTYRTRGQAVDTLDIVMAVAWPALVVLMVHMFVSPRWTGLGWPMRELRWLGTLSIGAMAMRVSWVHLNDLMSSRGQKVDVAILGPLAIDALAIMATALILAGRRTVSNAQDSLPNPHVQPVGQVTPQDMGADGQDWTDHGPDGPWAKRAETLRQRHQSNVLSENAYGAIGDEAEFYLSRLSRELDSSTTPAAPVISMPTALPQRKRPAVMSDEGDVEAAAYAQVGRDHGLAAGDISELLGGWYGVSARTIRRRPWWTSATRVN